MTLMNPHPLMDRRQLIRRAQIESVNCRRSTRHCKQVGRIEVELDVLFANGETSHTSFKIDVVPSSKGLEKFYINHGSHALAVVLEDKEADRQVWLSPEVYFKQLDYPIYLTNSNQIRFSV
jgi:hypothetical protein